MMRKFVLVLVLVCCCFSLSGCYFYDEAHNRRHTKIILRDFRALHEDIDWLLGLDEPTRVDEGYFR